MANFKQLFMNYMTVNGIKYTDKGENVVLVSYGAKNIKSVPVYVFFSKDGEGIAQFKCWEIANFKDKEAKALIACNELNSTYRWVKFYMDKDSDIVVDCDAYLDEDTCGEECVNLIRRLVSIVDEGYPVIGKALWS